MLHARVRKNYRDKEFLIPKPTVSASGLISGRKKQPD
jgi:hypothetical protein